jgi:hypothetical protein
MTGIRSVCDFEMRTLLRKGVYFESFRSGDMSACGSTDGRGLAWIEDVTVI